MGGIIAIRILIALVLLVGTALAAWAGTVLLGAAYELRKFGSPYGFLDLQQALRPAAAQAILESWAVKAGTDAFGHARTYALWDMMLAVGVATTLTGTLLAVRGLLQAARRVPSNWTVSNGFAALLDHLLWPAQIAILVGAACGIGADAMYRAVLGTATVRGPAAAVGWSTTVASALSWGQLVLTASAVFVLLACILYLLARNRSPSLREFIEVLRVTRFSLLTVVAVGVGLCVPDQLRDAFRALAEGHWLRMVVTELVLLAWAFSVWYTGRFLLNVDFETARFGTPDPSTTPNELWGERHWPRILGTAAFGAVALATWLAWYDVADSPDVAYPALIVLSAVNVLLGIAFWQFTGVRRATIEQLKGQYVPPRGRLYHDMPASVQWLVRGAIAVVVLLWLLVFAFPQSVATDVGTVTLLLGAAITITTLGSLVVWLGERARVPAVSIIFGLAILFSFSNDNHAVRRLPDAPRPPRIEFAAHVKDWYDWIHRKYPDEKEHPLFIVSAAGGGIRAAYWTAAVLTRLQDLNPAFADHTVLISSVSGGSLGSLVFANLLDTTEAGGDWRGRHASFGGRADAECPYPAHAPGKYQALAARILARDFLAPTAASMLYGDFLARLLPYSVLSDRAEALELSWERAWDATKRQPPADLTSKLWDGNPFSRSFDTLYDAQRIISNRPLDARHVPLVVVNGTIVETGTRITVSHLRHPPAFKGDVENAFDHRDAPMRMSTTALMSARFTYVSPAGTYAPGTHVVDGGYFENSGAATAVQWWGEVEDWVDQSNRRARRQEKRGEPAKTPIKYIFLHIDNGAPSDVPAVPQGGTTAPQPQRMEVRAQTPGMLPELSAPINALLAAREAHAVEAKTRAKHAFDAFVTFDTSAQRDTTAATTQGATTRKERLTTAPLGWVLSRSAQQILDRQLCRNGKNIGTIIDALPKRR